MVLKLWYAYHWWYWAQVFSRSIQYTVKGSNLRTTALCFSCCLSMSLSLSLPLFTFLFVEPADAAAVVVWFEEQLLEELPQVDGLAGVTTHHI